MRGKGSRHLSSISDFGITPAYAGKRNHFLHDFARKWDHPRVCGEKPKFELDKLNSVGSPPRMRGKDAVIDFVSVAGGITPAYAGKRIESKGNAARRWDHPRACGEKRFQHGGSHWGLGSPPRMRGKVCIAL